MAAGWKEDDPRWLATVAVIRQQEELRRTLERELAREWFEPLRPSRKDKLGAERPDAGR